MELHNALAILFHRVYKIVTPALGLEQIKIVKMLIIHALEIVVVNQNHFWMENNLHVVVLNVQSQIIVHGIKTIKNVKIQQNYAQDKSAADQVVNFWLMEQHLNAYATERPNKVNVIVAFGRERMKIALMLQEHVQDKNVANQFTLQIVINLHANALLALDQLRIVNGINS